MSEFRRRLMIASFNSIPSKPTGYIKFEDPEVERICVQNFSSDGIGVTYDDAEKVTNLKSVFRGNTNIKTFNEINYFKNLSKFNNGEFFACNNLTFENINLGNITEIGGGAFNGTKIKKIEIHNNKTLVIYNPSSNTGGAFSSCKELSEIDFTDCRNIVLGANAFLKCTSLISAKGFENCTKYGNNSFSGCSNLIRINLSQEIEHIGNGAFYKCINLKVQEISLPKLNKIEGGAFVGTLVSSILDLGIIKSFERASGGTGGSFGNCQKLSLVILPNTLEKILNPVFEGCKLLKTLICKSLVPPSIVSYGGSFLNGCDSLNSIYVPDESVEAYKTAPNWSKYANKINPLSSYTEL